MFTPCSLKTRCTSWLRDAAFVIDSIGEFDAKLGCADTLDGPAARALVIPGRADAPAQGAARRARTRNPEVGRERRLPGSRRGMTRGPRRDRSCPVPKNTS